MNSIDTILTIFNDANRFEYELDDRQMMNPGFICGIESYFLEKAELLKKFQENRLNDLQQNGPSVFLCKDKREAIITLLRDGREVHYCLDRFALHVERSNHGDTLYALNLSGKNYAEDGYIYFIRDAATSTTAIWLSKEEANILEKKIFDINDADYNTPSCDRCYIGAGNTHNHYLSSEEIAKNADESAKAYEKEKAVEDAEMATWRKSVGLEPYGDAERAAYEAEHMAMTHAALIKDYGSEEAFMKARAAGDEAMRLIQISERKRLKTEGYKY